MRKLFPGFAAVCILILSTSVFAEQSNDACLKQVQSLKKKVEAFESKKAIEEANKALIKRWLAELWDKGNYAVAQEILVPDFIRHSKAAPATGPKQYAAIVKSCHDAFPDTKIELVDMIAEGDKVFVRWSWTGTHKAAFRKIPPTGKKIHVFGCDLIRIKDGKLVELWPLFDPLRLMKQLGILSMR